MSAQFKPGTVESWFPQNIYCADNVLSEDLPHFEEIIYGDLNQADGKPLSKELNVVSNHTPYLSMLDKYDVFQGLKAAIMQHTVTFCRMTGYSDRLKWVNAWANISKQGDFLFPHIHENSLWSGAYYVKAAETDHLTFYKDHSVLNVPSKPTRLSTPSVNYQCKPGRILVFRSDLLHGYGKQISEEDKIVISFNLKLED